MQKKFLALCFLVGALGAVSVQAGDNKKKSSSFLNDSVSWKDCGYSVLKYGVLPFTGINMGFQLTRLFTSKIVTGIAAKAATLSTIKFVGPCGTAVVTKFAPYLLYGYGIPAFLFVGAGGTLAYKAWVLKKSIIPDFKCGATDTGN